MKEEKKRERWRLTDTQRETAEDREKQRETEKERKREKQGKRLNQIIYKLFVIYNASKSDIFPAKSQA